MDFDLVHIWQQMTILNKIIIVILFLMSLWSIYLIISRYFALRSGLLASNAFVAQLGTHLQEGREREALQLANSSLGSPVAHVLRSGLQALVSGRDAMARGAKMDSLDLADSVNRAIERAKEREGSELRKGLGFLGTTATSTPFIGLLGTVVGIIGAFQLLKGGGTIETVGPAIAEALIATAFGLMIAIVAAVAFNYFTGKVEHMMVDVNDVSSEFLDYVAREGR